MKALMLINWQNAVLFFVLDQGYLEYLIRCSILQKKRVP